jgi:hypothetical protein
MRRRAPSGFTSLRATGAFRLGILFAVATAGCLAVGIAHARPATPTSGISFYSDLANAINGPTRIRPPSVLRGSS